MLASLALPGVAAAVLVVGLVHALPVPAPPEPPAQQSLVWGDRVFASSAEFRAWLVERGQTYEGWARSHPVAAARLEVSEAAARASGERAESSRAPAGRSDDDATQPSALTGNAARVVGVVALLALAGLVIVRGSRRTGLSRPLGVLRSSADAALRAGLRADAVAVRASVSAARIAAARARTLATRARAAGPPTRRALRAALEAVVVAAVMMSALAVSVGRLTASRLGTVGRSLKGGLVRLVSPSSPSVALALGGPLPPADEPLPRLPAPPRKPRTPAEEPIVVARRTSAPAKPRRRPPPRSAAAWEECRIDWWRGYVKSQFFAGATADDSADDVIAASPWFRWRDRRPPPPTPPVAAAHQALVDRLLEEGWQMNGVGSLWYTASFRRPRLDQAP